MKQKGVTRRVISMIKKEYVLILDSQGLTPTKAFAMPANSIKGIRISGRTLRKIFNGKQVHIHTISKIVTSLGRICFLRNGILDISNEKEKEAQ